MDRTRKPRTSVRALPGRNAWLRITCDQTAGLRARLLAGRAEATQVTRDTFHLLYWEHRGQQVFPLRDNEKNSPRGDR